VFFIECPSREGNPLARITLGVVGENDVKVSIGKTETSDVSQ
jgi:hypothetical protein